MLKRFVEIKGEWITVQAYLPASKGKSSIRPARVSGHKLLPWVCAKYVRLQCHLICHM
jgi:hypothetical protein